MIKDHVICDTVVSLDSYVLIDFFSKLMQDYSLLKEIYTNVQQYSNKEMDDDDIEDFFLDVHFESISSFRKLARLYICDYQPVNIYFLRTSHYFESLVELCTNISNRYYSPNESETEEILDLTYKTLAGVCFLLGTDYHCYDTVKASIDGREVDYDKIVYEHFSKFSLVTEDRLKMCLDFAKDVFDTSKEFKIKFDVFDACPEKEAQFTELLGPDIGAIDETQLTIALVDDLLSGKISVEELLEKCSYSEAVEPQGSTEPVTIEV